MTRLGTLALFSAAGLALAAPAYAGGFYLQEQGVRGTGRAYSGEVADTGVESLWWNPAAIARSGREVYVGINGIFVTGSANNRGSTKTFPGGLPLPTGGVTVPTTLPVGGDPIAYNPVQKGVLPNFDIAMPIGDRFAVGLSAHAPFDFQSLYQSTAWTRYDALKSRLLTIDLQFTGAMKVTDWLDVGVSADTQYTSATLTNAVPNLSPLLPDGFNQLKGDGWNWGWSIGAQAHFDRLTLGASYRSSIDHEVSGQVIVSGLLGPLAAGNIDVPGKAKFKTPWIATLGARYRITDKLTLNGQVQRIGWSEFKNIEVTTAAGATLIPEDYKNITSGGAGVDYEVNPTLTLRAGFQYDPTPTRNPGRSARVPDGNRWLIGVGSSAHITQAMTFDAALAYVNFQTSSINRTDVFFANTPVPVTTDLHGQMKGQGFVLSLGLRSSF